ncbi:MULTISPECIES: DUF3068 domain-containing protein [Streptosporangium]|uniref:DUF3068 domain-containing protein n=1 Tax=Streptosporangium brasiliense TaxID=47480 RepID=A0ABT9R0D5_9ACTN|nr:DUF3068 domain-containing protein [Streptosporangium brasiliense]MDP9862680.1 hypothetical protein [Streptosporangium brasiliense]
MTRSAASRPVIRSAASRAVLVGTGAFLVTLAALLRFYVYDSVLVLPLEQSTTYHLVAQDADYFDTATLTSHARVPLVSTRTVSGDTRAGDAGTAVWVEFASLTTASGDRIDYHERRTAFDRRTGMAVACCGEYVDEDPRARQTGLAFRLPFRAEPRSYPMYDTVLRTAVPLRYEQQEQVEGLRTYRYTYTAGPIKIEDIPGQFPGKVLGLPEWRAIGVSRYAQVTRTIWVEPESGMTVKVRESHRQGLRTPDGIERRVSLRADLSMPPEEVRGRAADARAFTRWVLAVRDLLPGLFLVAGLVLALLGRRPRRPPRSPGPEDAGPSGPEDAGPGMPEPETGRGGPEARAGGSPAARPGSPAPRAGPTEARAAGAERPGREHA